MAIWNKNTQEEKEAQKLREQEQAESLRALESGGIPLQAERRLREQKEQQGFFSSDLSTNEHLLVRHSGFEPLGQVMGSSFYSSGYSGYFAGAYQTTGELSSFTQSQLATRSLAISRLKQEAALLGAQGVVGVRFTRKTPDWGNQLVEFTAIGTAVRVADRSVARAEEPFTSALSGQEFWKLHQAGFLPTEIAFGVCSFYIHTDNQAAAVLNNLWGAGMSNQELVHYTRGFQIARDLAMTRFANEVKRANAQGAVGVEIDWNCEEIEYEMNDRSYVDLLVHFAAIGTAIVAKQSSGSSGTTTLSYYDLKDRASFHLSPKE